MTSGSTQFLDRYSPITATPARTRIPARYVDLTRCDPKPASANRGFPGVGSIAAWIIAVLVVGSGALAVAALAIGGSMGLVLGWSIVPDLTTAALIAVCSASYGSRGASRSTRGDALARSQVQFDKA